ncbi:SOUL family heme-binding protein [Mycolicibacterium goodii]|uniref:Heme-binding protein n=1 Tax=Mycolicibacterium goodii TaxID=134601 RepID=A0ABS6HIR5_MYCGD|nr:heme-binding protein [Mycolicibacterium goodii]MBU8822138.1 heme-binding protein [Mycolicibacterium goodii]MBU8834903.1 heme-binding protein [Mycolicibacterium goodii]PJK21029.1 heme-binding protein [Mycolicibacterium goodii]
MFNQVRKLVVGVVQGAASAIGCRVGTEEPSYRAEPLAGGVELRRYGPRLAAETTVTTGDRDAALHAGFRRLAGYIFGRNHGGGIGNQKIAMTAPVAQGGDAEQGWDVRFYLPSGMTMQTVPTPDDSRVRIVELPEQSVAVLRFSGDRGADAVARHTAKLREALRSSGLEERGEPTAWFYDPPWTPPFLRRNEIAIPVDV